MIELNPATLQLFASGQYEAPTGEEVKAVAKMLGMDARQVAALVGVVNIRTVRRWMAAATAKTRAQIDYAAWRLMLLEAGLVRPSKRRQKHELA